MNSQQAKNVIPGQELGRKTSLTRCNINGLNFLPYRDGPDSSYRDGPDSSYRDGPDSSYRDGPDSLSKTLNVEKLRVGFYPQLGDVQSQKLTAFGDAKPN